MVRTARPASSIVAASSSGSLSKGRVCKELSALAALLKIGNVVCVKRRDRSEGGSVGRRVGKAGYV